MAWHAGPPTETLLLEAHLLRGLGHKVEHEVEIRIRHCEDCVVRWKLVCLEVGRQTIVGRREAGPLVVEALHGQDFSAHLHELGDVVLGAGVSFKHLVNRDERGFFVRTWCEQEFAAHGLNVRWPQGNLTRTLRRGMIRGLHWQAEPKPETKLVRCAAGAIWDVVVDVRRESPTFGRWEAFELTAENDRQLYIPAGIAHGFQNLIDGSEVSYLMSEFYDPALARGARWNDPEIGIHWPVPEPLVSERDAGLPALAVAHT